VQGTQTAITLQLRDTAAHFSQAAVQSGETTFVVTNLGKRPHSVELAGPGLRTIRTSKLASGKSTTLVVTLRPGAYSATLLDTIGVSRAGVTWLQVNPRVVMKGTGTSGVVQPPPDPAAMCGDYFSP
jgi:hypothetical protein